MFKKRINNILIWIQLVAILAFPIKDISVSANNFKVLDKVDNVTDSISEKKSNKETDLGKKLANERSLEILNKSSTDRFIIKYKNEKTQIEMKDNLKSKIKSEKKIENNKYNVIVTKDKMKTSDLIDEFKKNNLDADIEYIQPDYKVGLSSNDTYFNKQWGIYNSNVSTINSITEKDSNKQAELSTFRVDAKVTDAWSESQGEGAIVAVLDTGIDINHEDLADNIWKNKNEIAGNGIDDDGNGFIDDINGWNFYDNSNVVYDSELASDQWHGTHVAGIIGATTNNDKGIAGVAPKVQIMPLTVFNNGQAYTSEIIDAIEYATKMGAKIANCSWGGSKENMALKEVIDNSGMLFITASGNSGVNIDVNPIYPASYQSNNIISVASINNDGTLASFSNYGVNSVDVAAPGVDIMSTLPNNGYGESSGTSMSAAFVSGEAALILSKYGNMSADELKNKITESSAIITLLQDKVFQGNMIDCYNAFSTGANDKKRVIPLTKEQIVLNKENTNDNSEAFSLFSNNTWSYLANMQKARCNFASVTANNRIYAIGGNTTSEGYTKSVEVYDTASNTWSYLASMPTGRDGLVAAEVNGKIYAIGGSNAATSYLNTVEVYDIASNTWTTGPSMPTARMNAGIAVVNGKIYVIGGKNGAGYSNKVEVYNPSTSSWETKASLLTPRGSLSTTELNGEIYAIGGYYGSGYLVTNQIERYNPNTNVWTIADNMITGRAELSTVGYEGKIYIIGGYRQLDWNQQIDGYLSILDTVEQYDPSTNSWLSGASMSTPRRNLGACAVNSNFYAFGGETTEYYLVSSMEKAVVSLIVDEYPDNISLAQLVDIGYEVNGVINCEGDVDYLKFTPEYSGNYTMETIGSTDTYGYLYDYDQSELEYNDDSNGSLNFSINYNLIANQTYYVKIRHYSNSGIGAYSFIVKGSNSDFSTAVSIQIGSQISQAIEYGGAVDYFKFTPNISGTYTMGTTGTIDTYGYLYDYNKNLLAYNDDSNGTVNFSIKYNLIANKTYYIKVRHYNGYSVGEYILNVAADTQQVKYEYDINNRLKRIIRNGKVIKEFIYDNNGNLKTIQNVGP